MSKPCEKFSSQFPTAQSDSNCSNTLVKLPIQRPNTLHLWPELTRKAVDLYIKESRNSKCLTQCLTETINLLKPIFLLIH